MNSTITTIPFENLLLMLIPVALVLWLQFRWSLNYREGTNAVLRMLAQLLIVGYLLGYIFNADSYWLVLLIIAIMITASSWISLRTIKHTLKQQFTYVLIAMLFGGGSVLILVTQLVLDFTPWYKPQFMVPLAGMIFSNCINSISLGGERYLEELDHGKSALDARNSAYRIAMIPATNALLAVGLVSLPGMMTGQILAGVDPLIAVRYQIMVMAMIYSAEGLSCATYLSFITHQKRLRTAGPE